MKTSTLLVAALILSSLPGCAPSRADGGGDALLPSGGDAPDAWFRLANPRYEDADGDGIWAAGESLLITIDFINQGPDHYRYPGVQSSTDVQEVSVQGNENWWYGIDAGQTYEAQVQLWSPSEMGPGTLVNVLMIASSLSCDDQTGDQLEFCPDPNPLTLPLRVGGELPVAP